MYTAVGFNSLWPGHGKYSGVFVFGQERGSKEVVNFHSLISVDHHFHFIAAHTKKKRISSFFILQIGPFSPCNGFLFRVDFFFFVFHTDTDCTGGEIFFFSPFSEGFLKCPETNSILLRSD